MRLIKENKNNYLIKSYERFGEDFLDSLEVTVEDIQANAMNIMRDILYNKINLAFYGKYILNPNVIGNIKYVIAHHSKEAFIIYNSLVAAKFNVYYNNVDNDYSLIECKYSQKVHAFNQLLSTIDEVMKTNNITLFSLVAVNLKEQGILNRLFD